LLTDVVGFTVCISASSATVTPGNVGQAEEDTGNAEVDAGVAAVDEFVAVSAL